MIDLRNSINSKEIPWNENPKKVVNIVAKILDFSKQQKGEEIKVLTLEQMFQKLPIVLALVKVDYTSENLLNEIRQTIYSFYRKKEVTTKV